MSGRMILYLWLVTSLFRSVRPTAPQKNFDNLKGWIRIRNLDIRIPSAHLSTWLKNDIHSRQLPPPSQIHIPPPPLNQRRRFPGHPQHVQDHFGIAYLRFGGGEAKEEERSATASREAFLSYVKSPGSLNSRPLSAEYVDIIDEIHRTPDPHGFHGTQDHLSSDASVGSGNAREGGRLVDLEKRRVHRFNRRKRENERVDRFMEALITQLSRSDKLIVDDTWTDPPQAGRYPIKWSDIPPSTNPRLSSRRMSIGTPRGERKIESVEAFGWALRKIRDYITDREPHITPLQPLTVVDAGSGTGNLVLPLAASGILPKDTTWIAIDFKPNSIKILNDRANSSDLLKRDGERGGVVGVVGRIEDYTGPCHVVLSLHACGDATDAALDLAQKSNAPFIASPCCLG
ncbi:hypothetical protein AAMO2058_001333100 [Amorphochlora amoebiformis]